MELAGHEHDEKMEAGELLEDCWFFANLLDRKTCILRSLSDPSSNCSKEIIPSDAPDKLGTIQMRTERLIRRDDKHNSGNCSQQVLPGKSYEETYAAIKKLPGREEPRRRSDLTRAPSMPLPPYMERMHQNPTKGATDPGRSKSSKGKSSSKNLRRAPSLPVSMVTEESQDDEIEFSLGKLIRQASMNSSDTLARITHTAAKEYLQHVAPGSSTSSHQLKEKPEVGESVKLEGLEKTRPRRQMNPLKTQKSLSYLETQGHLKGFKDLGLDFKEKNTKRPTYIPEAWQAKTHPVVPDWGSNGDNMKAQIKFWARAVASNVRQEC